MVRIVSYQGEMQTLLIVGKLADETNDGFAVSAMRRAQHHTAKPSHTNAHVNCTKRRFLAIFKLFFGALSQDISASCLFQTKHRSSQRRKILKLRNCWGQGDDVVLDKAAVPSKRLQRQKE